jgi:hypothetical protein
MVGRKLEELEEAIRVSFSSARRTMIAQMKFTHVPTERIDHFLHTLVRAAFGEMSSLYSPALIAGGFQLPSRIEGGCSLGQ